jgi:hypothetical protein
LCIANGNPDESLSFKAELVCPTFYVDIFVKPLRLRLGCGVFGFGV